MIVSSKVFGKHTGRSRAYVCMVVQDMRRMGYKVVRDGKTTLFDDKDAFECISRRKEEKAK